MTTSSCSVPSVFERLQLIVGLVILLNPFAINQSALAGTGDVIDLGIQLAGSGNFPKAMDADKVYPVSLKASNSGPVSATNVKVSVILPDNVTPSGLTPNCTQNSNVVICTKASLDAGKKFNVAFKIKASEAAIGAGIISSLIASSETDSVTGNNSLTTSIKIGSQYYISLTKSGNQAGTITGNGGLDCGDTCNVTVKSKKAAGDKITLKAVPEFRNKLVQWSGDTCKPTTAPPSCTFKAKSEQSYRVNAEFGTAPDEKVVLLLHGMNSSPSTWKDFVNKNFKACYTIDNGVVIGNTGKKFPVNCYAVKFGAYDVSGDPGLENARHWADKNKLATAGDFSTFNQLGKEVDKAVGAIKAYHPGAHIVLIGHSRGGLAARAFLANKSAAAPLNSLWTDYVDGLITTGSPHKGTPIGKIYAWLDAHPRSSCGLFDNYDCFRDWKAVDELKLLLRSVNYGLDTRRPVIAYLATGSTQLAKLNSGTLPDSVAYGQLRYGGMRLGLLNKNYDIFPSGRNGGHSSLLAVQLTDPAIDFMLGNAVNANNTAFDGDGIVPLGNQGYGGDEVVDKSYLANKVLHTEEPRKAADINAMLCKLKSPARPLLSFPDWVKCP